MKDHLRTLCCVIALSITHASVAAAQQGSGPNPSQNPEALALLREALAREDRKMYGR